MTKLIINADDFGYSKAINYGIIESHIEGVLTSTTMMANMPGFEHAAQLAKDYPTLAIGAHLVLTCGRPVLSKSSLTQGNGGFLSRKDLNEQVGKIDLEAVYQEWDAQIQKLYKAGISLTHLDTHHYVHGLGELYQPMERLSEKYELPMRNCLNVKSKLSNPRLAPADDLWLMFIDEAMKDLSQPYNQVRTKLLNIIEEDVQRFANKNLIEANCHPGFLDTTVMFGSSFTHARMREIELLCDPSLRGLLNEAGFELGTY
ncbi:carbohydrate deacetylase [Vagococcus zengguangii]|uniref:Carbohydrate deacetylase n=1 Tax=Vagococcus zengguangii TaxID=2571750 RepID=A0A4D7CPV4_9ENTE|nr:carbohydrate deacetylase [Vagococcus zengguangii]QCI86089.1 carbohydrate deacetylase [Vagococcus zengguangii]